jgi:putative membrane protein
MTGIGGLKDLTVSRGYLHSGVIPWAAALWLWLALLIATPISMWIGGAGLFPLMATLGVLAQTGVTLMTLAGTWSLARIAKVMVVVLIGAWGVEELGLVTGFPFGRYTYTQALQPQLAGVPLLIPLAWLMMLPPAWAAAEAILAGWQERLGIWYALLQAVLAGLAFTAWDLYLDPQMVSRGLWVWGHRLAGYFGIPWSNFIGWWLSATLLTLAVRPLRLPRARLLAIYSLTWAFQAIGLGIFWGQPGPALAGLIGMGMWVVWAWYKEWQAWKSSSGR